MAADQQWQLRGGVAHVFPGSDRGIARPLILAADGQDRTDLTAFKAGIDHAAYSFLKDLHTRGSDLILVGYSGDAPLADHAGAVQEVIGKAVAERIGEHPLAVGGIGRGALTTRYALCKMESTKSDAATRAYFSYNGRWPSPEEEEQLNQMGSWPSMPYKLKAVSADQKDEEGTMDFNDSAFDDFAAGPANTGGPLITRELGRFLLDRIFPA